VAKDLRGIPKTDVKRILSRMQALRDDPRAPGCEKLSSNSDLYRVRQGVCRIIYAIFEAQVVVEVVKVGHRSEVYRGWRRALRWANGRARVAVWTSIDMAGYTAAVDNPAP
jgi:mRNA interferase RelE/StbE